MHPKSDDPADDHGLEVEIDGQRGFAVIPKSDCPHIQDSMIANLDSAFTSLKSVLVTSPCKECGDLSENWYCMACENTFCSRYVNKHMTIHYEVMKHPVAFSLSDGSFWCYECNSYITNTQMNYLQSKYSYIKFPDGD